MNHKLILYTGKGAQDYLKLTFIYLHRYIKKGKLNPISIHGRNYYIQEDLDNIRIWIESNKNIQKNKLKTVYSISQAATLCRVSRQTIYNLIKQTKVETKIINGLQMIEKSSLLHWKKSRKKS